MPVLEALSAPKVPMHLIRRMRERAVEMFLAGSAPQKDAG
jgi:hypothetical protein